MNIQIIGTRNSANTRKAQRFFKERAVPFHFVDLKERSLSQGELEKITRVIPADQLIDSQSQLYKKRGFAYLDFDAAQEILEHPLLLKQPIVRNGSLCTVELAENTWTEWIRQEK